MNTQYRRFSIAGAIFTLLVGTLLYFTYTLSGENHFVALFSAVNESTWEHLKLLFFPLALFAIPEFFIYGRNIPDFALTKLVAVLCGMGLLVILFYTYTGIVGRNFAAADIVIFVVAASLSSFLSSRWLAANLFAEATGGNLLGWLLLLLLAVLFFAFTFDPPKIGLFRDPQTGGYGLPA